MLCKSLRQIALEWRERCGWVARLEDNPPLIAIEELHLRDSTTSLFREPDGAHPRLMTLDLRCGRPDDGILCVSKLLNRLISRCLDRLSLHAHALILRPTPG